MIRDFVVEESGATSIEYALIASMFAVVVLGAVSVLADNVSVMWTTIESAIAP